MQVEVGKAATAAAVCDHSRHTLGSLFGEYGSFLRFVSMGCDLTTADRSLSTIIKTMTCSVQPRVVIPMIKIKIKRKAAGCARDSEIGLDKLKRVSYTRQQLFTIGKNQKNVLEFAQHSVREPMGGVDCAILGVCDQNIKKIGSCGPSENIPKSASTILGEGEVCRRSSKTEERHEISCRKRSLVDYQDQKETINLVKKFKSLEDQKMYCDKDDKFCNHRSGQGGKAKEKSSVMVNRTSRNSEPTPKIEPRIEAPQPSYLVCDALKSASRLENFARRVRINSGSGRESTLVFFEAGLEYLSGAAQTEACDGGKTNAMEAYSTAATLCQYCAHEFQSHKMNALAALAYKCTEVSFMRIVYSANFPESTSRQASTCPKKETAGKTTNVARNINQAMEASRKSREVFGASEVGNKEGILSVQRALDFSFHDVKGFINLVRLAMHILDPW